MPGSKRKNPARPSFEEGKFRDETISKAQDPKFQPSDLKKLIAKAVIKKAPEGA